MEAVRSALGVIQVEVEPPVPVYVATPAEVATIFELLTC
jgi:hypothetical protein